MKKTSKIAYLNFLTVGGLVLGFLLAGFTSQAQAAASVGKPVDQLVGLDNVDAGIITLDERGNISGSFNGFFGPYDVTLTHIASTVNPAWVDGLNNPLEVTSYLVKGKGGIAPLQLEAGALGITDPGQSLLSDVLIFSDLGIDGNGFGLTRIDFLSDVGTPFSFVTAFNVQEDVNGIAVHRAFGVDNAERMTYNIISPTVPEPSTALVGVALVGVTALRRLRR